MTDFLCNRSSFHHSPLHRSLHTTAMTLENGFSRLSRTLSTILNPVMSNLMVLPFTIVAAIAFPAPQEILQTVLHDYFRADPGIGTIFVQLVFLMAVAGFATQFLAFLGFQYTESDFNDDGNFLYNGSVFNECTNTTQAHNPFLRKQECLKIVPGRSSRNSGIMCSLERETIALPRFSNMVFCLIHHPYHVAHLSLWSWVKSYFYRRMTPEEMAHARGA